MSGIRGLFLLEVSCCSEWVFEVIGREILSSATLFPGRLRQCSQNTRSRRCARLSFRGRTAVPLHAFCPDVGPKWSRSPLRGDLPESRFWTARASEKSGYLRIADYSRTCLNANKMGSISSRHSIRITITRSWLLSILGAVFARFHLRHKQT